MEVRKQMDTELVTTK